jgi:3-oxoacyl-[acyl-carrier-protein] synthase III
MPALTGQTVMTLRDGSGAVVIEATTNFDPATFALVDRQVVTTDATRTGALVVDNRTDRQQRVAVTNAQGVTRRLTVSRNGEAFTAAQLAAQNLTVLQDVNGLTFELV